MSPVRDGLHYAAFRREEDSRRGTGRWEMKGVGGTEGEGDAAWYHRCAVGWAVGEVIW